MSREDFFEKLDDFDFDSFGKDGNFDNSDTYQIVQFFANKIFASLDNKTCDSCLFLNSCPILKEFNSEQRLLCLQGKWGCNKWEKKQ